jgi:hypothetical protein
VRITFNVADLSPFIRIQESRTTPFQKWEDDDDILDNVPNHGPAEPSQTLNTPIQGTITQSRANKLQQEVNSLLTKIDYITNENFICLNFRHMYC